MSDWALNFWSNWGQPLASILAIGAAIVGVLSSYASQQLTKVSDLQLLEAVQIIKKLQSANSKLQLQVGTVIGGAWTPLTSDQIELLRLKIESWGNPNKVQVMYENRFGKDLAESIANAFRAAKWTVMFSTGAGFSDGIEVGRGPISLKMQQALSDVLKIKDVRALRSNEDEIALFVGVGAKLEEQP